MEKEEEKKKILVNNNMSLFRNLKKEIDVKRMMKPLRKVWIKIGLKKLDTYEEVVVEILLYSKATELFMNPKFAKIQQLKLEKLRKAILVKDMNRTLNVKEVITHEIEVNIYFQRHIERIKINICDIRKANLILGML